MKPYFIYRINGILNLHAASTQTAQKVNLPAQILNAPAQMDFVILGVTHSPFTTISRNHQHLQVGYLSLLRPFLHSAFTHAPFFGS